MNRDTRGDYKFPGQLGKYHCTQNSMEDTAEYHRTSSL